MEQIKQFVVRLSDDEHEKLKQLAFKREVSIQHIFKEMVEKYLEKCEITKSTKVAKFEFPKEEVSKVSAAVLRDALTDTAEKMKELGEIINKLYEK